MVWSDPWCADARDCHEDDAHIAVWRPIWSRPAEWTPVWEEPGFGDGGADSSDTDYEWEPDARSAEDEREPEPFDPGFEPADGEPTPPDDPEGDGDATLRNLRRRMSLKIGRGIREARSYLALAWITILDRLTTEERAIFRRWFPGGTTEDLRKVAAAILGAHNALGTANALFITDEDIIAEGDTEDAFFHKRARTAVPPWMGLDHALSRTHGKTERRISRTAASS